MRPSSQRISEGKSSQSDSTQSKTPSAENAYPPRFFLWSLPTPRRVPWSIFWEWKIMCVPRALSHMKRSSASSKTGVPTRVYVPFHAGACSRPTRSVWSPQPQHVPLYAITVRPSAWTTNEGSLTSQSHALTLWLAPWPLASKLYTTLSSHGPCVRPLSEYLREGDR